MVRRGFIINRNVEFWPDEQKLFSRNESKTVFLYYPASCMLLTLINNKNVIVSQAELIRSAWGSDAVTHNRLYQSILNLRKALLDIGLPKDTIKTIPRNGLSLSANVIVEPINTQRDITLATSIIPHDINNVTSPVQSEKLENKKRKKPSSRLIIKTTCLLASITLFSVALKYSMNVKKNYFDGYYKIREVNGCTYYSLRDEKEKYFSLVAHYKTLCPQGNNVYLQYYDSIKKYSAITCNKNHNKDCISTTYIGD
ncbi:winged helix-turn-helix domain-containing protein [Serratia fonticola]|uniref:winged helix-turn-helix domain-containing protein n=1 Tax=Serratia fonticola TaxID=47917 RepID=UPI0024DDFEEA|nr:winged helix-turn-helix domain-containing protein [Serratia fonticola]MDK2375748.1 winged helix-turn-helix domain-containing protein [Serratia fonticola]